MPSSKNYFTTTIKNCSVCEKSLELHNTRDIERKRFCSASCRNKYGTKLRISKLPEKKCAVCNIVFKSKSLNQKYCSSKCCSSLQVTRSYKYLNNNLDGYILLLIKKKERLHLSLEEIKTIYIKQQGLCALSKVPMTCIKIPNIKKVHTNLSIDRIDSTRGYDLDNIQLVCAIVNIMKSSLTMQEFSWWIGMLKGGIQNS